MTGMGGWIAAIIILSGLQGYKFIPIEVTSDGARVLTLFNLLAISFVVAGLVGAARLHLKAHKPSELIAGFVGGFAAMFLGYMIIL